ncbi:hypothetical protein [Paenibacillus terreus]|uniref:hypothetical protein n=1 Tax=Paenibacillus terreus TaxID=1387834 RepID=UPI0035CD1B73
MQMAFDIFGDSLYEVKAPDRNTQPTDMTLSAFLASPYWRAVPDPKARPEHKGMYVMIQPNGEPWQGGWIGKFKNEETAKRSFHRDRIFYAILWGKQDIDDMILKDYADLKRAQDAVHEMMKQIHVGDPYVRVRMADEEKFFHLLDFPLYSRVEARGFVKDHGLECRSFFPSKSDTIFGPVEISAIALSRFLSDYLPEGHRPHLLIPEYYELTRSPGKYVQFRVPVEFDLQGEAIGYQLYEGISVYPLGGTVPRIEYTVDGDTKHWWLYPSQLTAIIENRAGRA